MLLLGLAGAAGSGKDEAAAYLEAQHGFEVLAFAWPLKEGLVVMLREFGLSLEHFQSRELKEAPLAAIGHSPRMLLQTLGTEWGRELVHRDLWVRIAAARLHRLRAEQHAPAIAFSDVRFPNEQAWIRDQGGDVWAVQRPITRGVRPHTSEHELDLNAVDRWILNDGTVEVLHERIDRLVERLQSAP